MKKIFNFLSYYILLLLGLFGASWIIWSRFFRERVIRDVPDALLTEYRVWILVYLCCIYVIVIKNLIKEPKTNIYVSTINNIISNFVWKPLVTLDHFIKYNKYWKNYYNNFMINFIENWDSLSANNRCNMIISFQILPRIILVIFLFLDVFYFNKIEIFYKVVLIGLLPFLFRYIEYSVKDFYEYLVKQLIETYNFVYIFEKGYSYEMSRKGKTDAIWHYERVSIEECIEILFETYLNKINESISYDYEASPYCKDHVYKEYEQILKKTISSWTDKDREQVYRLFNELIPQLLDIRLTLELFQGYKKERIIVWPKIGIFCIYLICWGYVLIISYYHYPIELPMFKYFIQNIMLYLIMGDHNPFIENLHSINENLITIENVKDLIKSIIKLILKKINKIIS